VEYFFNVNDSENGEFWSEDPNKARIYNMTTVLDTVQFQQPMVPKKLANLNNGFVALISKKQNLLVFKSGVNGELTKGYEL
jgi:hypothetical protein